MSLCRISLFHCMHACADKKASVKQDQGGPGCLGGSRRSIHSTVSITVLPVRKSLCGATPSARRAAKLRSVGVKCRLAKTPTKRRFASSGKGLEVETTTLSRSGTQEIGYPRTGYPTKMGMGSANNTGLMKLKSGIALQRLGKIIASSF